MTDPSSDTIFALSSGLPPAAIAVVRLSGPDAPGALCALTGRLPPAREARLLRLTWQGTLLDRALGLFFPGPASATGEDVVELHIHGGRGSWRAVKAALEGIGLREALPGEFTRRAFANGRLSLDEAEGLADLIEAETDSQRRAALSLAEGALGRQIASWQSRILDAAATLEASLDHSDEEEVGEEPVFDLGSLRSEIASWLARPPAERLKDGIRVVLAGPPNSGKSSLFNRLLGRDAAIVDRRPGTTRDLLEAPLALGGVPLLLIDSAGQRRARGRVEASGVERARRAASQADILIWMGSGSAPAHQCTISVQSKIDIEPHRDADLRVSAETGQGIEQLERTIAASAKNLLPAEGEVALNHRHRVLLREVEDELSHAESHKDPILRAEALRIALSALDRITGKAGTEDLLDALFARFCIGK